MGDSQKQRCGFNLRVLNKKRRPCHCHKQLPVEAAGCTLTHVEQQGEKGGIKERDGEGAEQDQ